MTRPASVARPVRPGDAGGTILWLCFGEGGHRTEARRLLDLLTASARRPLPVTCITDTPGIALGETGEFAFAPLRTKHARLLGALVHLVAALLRDCWLAFALVRTIPPHARVVAISLGPAFAVVPALFVRARGGVVVHIETACRFATRSLTGRLMYLVSHHFLVQNEEMLARYPRATYCGRL